ncbi:MAG: hypothetical protein FWC38_09050 [Proteobacteria bacterium]|nr:hypothetical protein [Pseudomonadota bacterium]MCL2308346.1 hypothetical protein [Pseudomonadota bacterium]
MKKTLFALSGVILFAWSLFAGAADPGRVEFKGIALGASQETLLKKFSDFRCSGGTCDLYVDAEAEKKCSGSNPKDAVEVRKVLDCQREYRNQMRYGPAAVQVYIAKFEGDKLGYVSIIFHSNWYRDVRDALVEKYGAQADEKMETVQNRFGDNFENRMATWKLGNNFVQIEERGAGIDTAAVRLVSGAFSGVDQEKLRRERAREAARDL